MAIGIDGLKQSEEHGHTHTHIVTHTHTRVDEHLAKSCRHTFGGGSGCAIDSAEAFYHLLKQCTPVSHGPGPRVHLSLIHI